MSEKNSKRGSEVILFWNSLEFLGFLLCPWKFHRQTKARRFTARNPPNPSEILRGLKLPIPLLEIPRFFLITPGNSTFFIKPQKIHFWVLQYPSGNSVSHQPPLPPQSWREAWIDSDRLIIHPSCAEGF